MSGLVGIAACRAKQRSEVGKRLVGSTGIGYLREPVHPGYVPVDHLARIYAANEYFGETRLNAANLDERMHRGMVAGGPQNALLKRLSSATTDWCRIHFPFAAVHLQDAPGAFADNERAVVAAWESLWAQLQGRTAPFFVYAVPPDGGKLLDADPSSALGQITVITSARFDMRTLTPADVRVTADNGDDMPVRVLPYLPDHEIDMAFIVQAQQPWTPGRDYTLPLRHADAEVSCHFGVAERADLDAWLAPRHTEPRPWRFGLWLFVVLLALALILFGFADFVFALIWSLRGWHGPPSGTAYLVARRTGKLLALAIAGIGIWLLLTDGNTLIEYLRLHH